MCAMWMWSSCRECRQVALWPVAGDRHDSGHSGPLRDFHAKPNKTGALRYAPGERFTKKSAAPTAISTPPKKRFWIRIALASRKKRCMDEAAKA